MNSSRYSAVAQRSKEQQAIAQEYRNRDRRTNERIPKKDYDIMPLVEAFGGYTYRPTGEHDV